MARTVISPRLVPSDAVMAVTVILSDVTPLTLQQAWNDAFPFPSGTLVGGHKITQSLADGTQVLLFACAATHAEGITEQGLATLKGETLLWLVAPVKPRLSKKTMSLSAALMALFFLTMQTINAGAERRLQLLQSQNKRSEAQRLSRVSSQVPQFLPRLIATIPPGVEVLSMDLDLSKRLLVLKARAPHYGGVSDTLVALKQLREISNPRASKSQLLQNGNQSNVDFTLDASLL